MQFQPVVHIHCCVGWQMQAQFATTPENIFGRRCPLNAHQVVEFRSEQAGTHFVAKVRRGLCVLEDSNYAASIGSRQSMQQRRR
jgi:hypothetical protein